MRGYQPHSRQEHPHDRRGYQPIAPAHDRGHDDPQFNAEDPARLHPHVQENLAAFIGRSPDKATFEVASPMHSSVAIRVALRRMRSPGPAWTEAAGGSGFQSTRT